ncbi:hypothetical protein [Nesterenkonia alba]|uniref:hypothetical protein n=1 Tax=Nesterenkonia alba TaxID=515814 RepID=UPI00048BDADA|nr:hypothetical protein [Nesterenkonia alba]
MGGENDHFDNKADATAEAERRFAEEAQNTFGTQAVSTDSNNKAAREQQLAEQKKEANAALRSQLELLEFRDGEPMYIANFKDRKGFMYYTGIIAAALGDKESFTDDPDFPTLYYTEEKVIAAARVNHDANMGGGLESLIAEGDFDRDDIDIYADDNGYQIVSDRDAGEIEYTIRVYLKEKLGYVEVEKVPDDEKSLYRTRFQAVFAEFWNKFQEERPDRGWTDDSVFLEHNGQAISIRNAFRALDDTYWAQEDVLAVDKDKQDDVLLEDLKNGSVSLYEKDRTKRFYTPEDYQEAAKSSDGAFENLPTEWQMELLENAHQSRKQQEQQDEARVKAAQERAAKANKKAAEARKAADADPGNQSKQDAANKAEQQADKEASNVTRATQGEEEIGRGAAASSASGISLEVGL